MHCWSLFWLLIVLHRDWFETAFISKIPFIKYAYNWLCIRFCFICIMCTPCLRINPINRVLLWYINYFYLYEKKNLNIYYIIWIIIHVHIDKGTAQFMQSCRFCGCTWLCTILQDVNFFTHFLKFSMSLKREFT